MAKSRSIIWHAVQCGSALLADSFYDLLGIKLAQVIFADPPYNVVI